MSFLTCPKSNSKHFHPVSASIYFDVSPSVYLSGYWIVIAEPSSSLQIGIIPFAMFTFLENKQDSHSYYLAIPFLIPLFYFWLNSISNSSTPTLSLIFPVLIASSVFAHNSSILRSVSIENSLA